MFPSVTVKLTAELPSAAGVPEISPVTASMTNPAGRPVALTLVAGLPPVVITWKLNRCPTLPVALVLLVMTGPEGAGCMVRVSVAVAVPSAFDALRATGNVPAVVGVPVMAARFALKVKPAGRLAAASEVGPLAWH